MKNDVEREKKGNRRFSRLQQIKGELEIYCNVAKIKEEVSRDPKKWSRGECELKESTRSAVRQE